jgi:hypothetical protein
MKWTISKSPFFLSFFFIIIASIALDRYWIAASASLSELQCSNACLLWACHFDFYILNTFRLCSIVVRLFTLANTIQTRSTIAERSCRSTAAVSHLSMMRSKNLEKKERRRKNCVISTSSLLFAHRLLLGPFCLWTFQTVCDYLTFDCCRLVGRLGQGPLHDTHVQHQ